jgi:hypothetical protein
MKKTIGIVAVASFAPRAVGVALGDDQIDLAGNQVGAQRRQPVIVALHPAIFDRRVVPLDIAGVAEALSETSQIGRLHRGGRRCAEKTDHRRR